MKKVPGVGLTLSEFVFSLPFGLELPMKYIVPSSFLSVFYEGKKLGAFKYITAEISQPV